VTGRRGAASRGVGAVEDVEQGAPAPTGPGSIEGPAVQAGLPRVDGDVEDGGRSGGLPGLGIAEARPAERVVERAGDGEHRVADHLGLEPGRGLAPEEAVTRVVLHRRGVEPRRLAIRGRRDDQPVHRLHAPSPRDHLRGEPVEELRMRRRTAIEAEVARRLDQSRPEVRLPEPIDDDAGEQWVARVGDPAGQPLPPLGLGGIGGEAENPRRDRPATRPPRGGRPRQAGRDCRGSRAASPALRGGVTTNARRAEAAREERVDSISRSRPARSARRSSGRAAASAVGWT